ncbi:polyketide antibiotic transporter [Mycobacterium hubeiense]|uniref:polyketide antibiotic transporter n=1 Tax=Mycobacterium hubeiense TaxID=1867256 RepID=UPI000C7EBE0F|nr:polyketide antibiotic transporter [Mycobacterium sp. QGD 101]
MTAAVLPTSGVTPLGPAAGRAVGMLAFRQVRRGALVVAALCAGMTTFVAAQYESMFHGALDQSSLRALADNPAIRTLFGPPVALDTAGGFTVWRTGVPVLLLASVWLLLTATRITRGEEDAGRWSLLLAGPLRLVDLVVRCLIALGVSAALIGCLVAIGLLAAGTDPTGAALYGIGVVGVSLTLACAGVLAAQVMPSRPAAVGLTVAGLGVGLLLRMLSDGVPTLAWSAWVTPFGLVVRSAPYADNRIAPLLVLAVFPVVLATAAVIAARHRDLDSGIVAVRTRRPPRVWLLGSVGGFAVRRALRPTLGWVIGVAAYFLLIGAVIATILDFFEQNRRFAELAAAAGFAGLDTANGFAAALFSLLAIPTGLYAATRLATMVADEKARRWTALFSRPIPRNHLAGNEIAVTAVGVIVLHTAAALAIWGGAAITGGGLGIGAALAGAANTMPIALLALGAAALALGWLPSWVGAIGSIPVVGGFLLHAVAPNDMLARLSPFAHVAAVPNAPPDWTGVAALTLITAAMVAAGLVGYSRRDLTT